MLRQAWGTSNARTLPISATGSAGMEAAFVNTVHPGDVVAVAVNGLFGQRMTDVAARLWRRGGGRRARAGPAGRRATRARGAPLAGDHRRCARRDLHGRPLRHRRAGRGQGRCAAARRRRHQHRRHRAARRRLGDRRRVRRHPEVPGRGAGTGAVHDQRPRVRATGGEAAVVVPRPRPARRVRRRGFGVRWPDLPPHRPGGDGREPARRVDEDPRGRPGRGLGSARGGRRAAPGRFGGDGPRAVRGEGPPAARADHRQGSRRRRLRRCTPLPAGALRHRDRCGSGGPTPRACGGSDSWATTRGRTPRCWCWRPSRTLFTTPD